MDQLNLTLLTEYAALVDEQRKLEAKLDAMKPLVIAEIKKQGTDANNYKGAFGTYTVKQLIRYKYSPQLELAKDDAAKKIKKMQQAEQEAGTAEKTVADSLSFLPAKED